MSENEQPPLEGIDLPEPSPQAVVPPMFTTDAEGLLKHYNIETWQVDQSTSDFGALWTDVVELGEMLQALTAIEAFRVKEQMLRSIHERELDGMGPDCVHDGEEWPCPTIKILDADIRIEVTR